MINAQPSVQPVSSATLSVVSPKTLSQSEPISTKVNDDLETTLPNLENQEWYIKVARVVSKSVALALTAQSLYGLYRSIQFILTEVPQISQLNQTTTTDITAVGTLGFKGVMIVATTSLGFFFAWQLQLFNRSWLIILTSVVAGLILFLFNFAALDLGLLTSWPLFSWLIELELSIINYLVDFFLA